MLEDDLGARLLAEGVPAGLAEGAGALGPVAVVRLMAADARALRERRVLAGERPRIVGAPPAAVHDDLVAPRHVLHVLAGGPHDAGAVAAARVEVLGLAQLLTLRDHVDGLA